MGYSVALNNPTEDGCAYEFAATLAACVLIAPTSDQVIGTLIMGGSGHAGIPKFYKYRAYIEWDISALGGAKLLANPIFRYEGVTNLATDEEINPFTEKKPTTCTDQEIFDYAASGVAYVDPWPLAVGANQSQDLGAQARADLQAAMNAHQSWFAIGLVSVADECPDDPDGGIDLTSTIYSEDEATANPKPTLYVEYMLPAAGGSFAQAAAALLT